MDYYAKKYNLLFRVMEKGYKRRSGNVEKWRSGDVEMWMEPFYTNPLIPVSAFPRIQIWFIALGFRCNIVNIANKFIFP